MEILGDSFKKEIQIEVVYLTAHLMAFLKKEVGKADLLKG